MPQTPAILETALYADDLDAAEAFYAGIIGLELVARKPGRHVFFRARGSMVLIFDPVAPRLTALTPDAPPGHGTFGRGHVCFAASREELAEWKKHFKAHGLKIEKEERWPNGARSIYLSDPGGNSVEFAEPGLWGFEDSAP